MNSILLFGMPGGTEWIIILVGMSLFALLPLLALVDIIRNDFRGSNDKVVWVLLVLFVPLVGSVLYFLIGRTQRVIN